jgi:hypothetical protein
MGNPVNPDPTDDSGQVPPQVPVKRPEEEPPVRPNPYMGGGEPVA